MSAAQIVFDDGAAYERYMSVWSQKVGHQFIDWLACSPGLRWLDVGCGNGAFTELVAERCAPLNLVGVDPSEAQLRFARTRPGCATAQFHPAGAQAMPFADDTFDVAVMPLVIFFVPDPAAGVAEMARVVQAGGTVSAYSWDLLGTGFPYQPVHTAFEALGIEVPMPPNPQASQMATQRELWAGAGLRDIQTRAMVVERTYADFNDYWQTLQGGPSVARQLAAISTAARDAVRERLRRQLETRPGSPVTCQATANAIKGTV